MYIESLSARYRALHFPVLLSRSILDNPSFDPYAKHPGIFFLLLASESPFVWKKARARISRGIGRVHGLSSGRIMRRVRRAIVIFINVYP